MTTTEGVSKRATDRGRDSHTITDGWNEGTDTEVAVKVHVEAH